MASHMGVQTFATTRNSQIEYFVGFILERFAKSLQASRQISSFEVQSQKSYVSNIASDVWDHQLTIVPIHGKTPIEFWCQTTCYKGNESGKPEPNKTYEVRETLVEAITLRELVESEAIKTIRTIHFTVGDASYTYQWFLDLKAASFDRSLYICAKGRNIFSDVEQLFRNTLTEDDKDKALDREIQQKSHLGKIILQAVGELEDWHKSGFNKCQIADLQWHLVKHERFSRSASIPDLSSVKGADIKGRVQLLLFGKVPKGDPLIIDTATKLLKKNPFLAAAISTIADWPAFRRVIVGIAKRTSSLDALLKELWNANPPHHLVLRRILLRIHSSDTISYIQDREIDGITEHNLYSGAHSDIQVRSICAQIKKDLLSAGINDKGKLVIALCRKQAKDIVNAARWFEAKNGTELKPSFEYVQLALKEKGFNVVSPRVAGLSAIGYHSEISSEEVKPYTNLKVVLTPAGRPLCFLKAKYFREQEFARRCKEESFVGLSLKYRYENELFVLRHKIPIIMFLDMANNFSPPEAPVLRLMSFGWDVCFSIDELVTNLKKSSRAAKYLSRS
jgi:hypothetical protein